MLTLKILLMFALTNIGWLMFRETDLHQLVGYLSITPSAASPLEWQAGLYFFCLVLIYSIPLIVHMCLDREAKSAGGTYPARRFHSLVFRCTTSAGLFGGILLLRAASSADFIYFQF
jgi:hypothetical protein